jgi:hypothetical protein
MKILRMLGYFSPCTRSGFEPFSNPEQNDLRYSAAGPACIGVWISAHEHRSSNGRRVNTGRFMAHGISSLARERAGITPSNGEQRCVKTASK